MKRKGWKVKVAKWYNDIDWQWVGVIFAFVLLLSIAFGLPMIHSYNKRDKTTEELLIFEEFTYKGHHYIKINEGKGLFDGFTVIHDPDCCK